MIQVMLMLVVVMVVMVVVMVMMMLTISPPLRGELPFADHVIFRMMSFLDNNSCSSKTQKLWESLDDIDVIRSQVELSLYQDVFVSYFMSSKILCNPEFPKVLKTIF